MNSTGNTSVRRAPSWMPSPSPIINSALSALAGAAVALGAVAAWDAYDDNSPSAPAFSSSLQVGGGSDTGRTGIVDPDPSVLYGSGVTSDAIQISAREPKLSLTGRTGHVDSDASVLHGGAISVNVPAYSPSKNVGTSPTGRYGQMDSDPEGLNVSNLPIVTPSSPPKPIGSSPTGRYGHVDSDASVLYGSGVTSDSSQPSASEDSLSRREGRRGQVFSE